MPKILIVEDSRLFSNLLKKRVFADFNMDAIIKASYDETVKLLEMDGQNFLLAILDLTLPGSPDGEIVDYVISKGLPAIVVSGRMDDQIREKILAKRVLDYIIKGPHTLDLLSSTIRRFLRNQDITILVVDDSSLSREHARKILETQHFKFLEAANGKNALKMLVSDPSIKLLLTDFNMPGMDGYELTSEIRKSHPMDKLAIIGMSAHGNPLISSQFLKRGANDFITKPYFEEELIWRVNQNIEMLERIALLRELTIRDALTGLHNRRYFFEMGEVLFENARRKNLDISVAMIDLDHFKTVNDLFGHVVGDQLLKQVGEILRRHFRKSDLVARFGGEEFIIMTSNMNNAYTFSHLDKLRNEIGSLTVGDAENRQHVTVSIGVTSWLKNNLDEMVKTADDLLYRAKKMGRNRIEIDS